MKRLVAFGVTLAALSCGNDGSRPTGQELSCSDAPGDGLVGTWIVVSTNEISDGPPIANMTVTLRSDGTHVQEADIEGGTRISTPGTWKIQNEVVIISYDLTGSSFKACVTVEGDRMTFLNPKFRQ